MNRKRSTSAVLPAKGITQEELLSALGAVRRARRILHPYCHGLFESAGDALEAVDKSLCEASLYLSELCEKPRPGAAAGGGA